MTRAQTWTCLGLLAVGSCAPASSGQTTIGASDPVQTSTDAGGGAKGGNGNVSGSTGGYSGSSGVGDGGSTKCQQFSVRAEPLTPDMLIVLDRSGSMAPALSGSVIDCTKPENADECDQLGIDCALPQFKNSQFCGISNATDRWTPSVTALKSITSGLDQKIRFGLMTFPSNDSCGAGSVLVPVDIGTSAKIANALDRSLPGGGTPTSATLDRALKALGGANAINPDVIAAPKSVLLVTDGQPTCPNGSGSVNATSAQLAADLQLTLTSIDNLLKLGVKTYVMGYDAQLDPQFADALTQFAKHGGTDNYHPVQDEKSLLAELDKITREVVSCSYQLKDVPMDPSYVLIRLDGKQLNLNDADGWSIQGKTVTLQGSACHSLQDGQNHELDVEVSCDVVNPI